ncbi:hypothetical protein L209DRAFT_471141 [Thermothelomyces heterothallicus CBS 203.75]
MSIRSPSDRLSWAMGRLVCFLPDGKTGQRCAHLCQMGWQRENLAESPPSCLKLPRRSFFSRLAGGAELLCSTGALSNEAYSPSSPFHRSVTKVDWIIVWIFLLAFAGSTAGLSLGRRPSHLIGSPGLSLNPGRLGKPPLLLFPAGPQERTLRN